MRSPITTRPNRAEAQQTVDAVRSVKSKVIDKVSDVMSYPARRQAQKQVVRDTNTTKDFKLVNQARGTQDKGDYTDPLFRARANVSNYKTEQMQALRKNSR